MAHTPVMFRTFPDGSILALFPTQPADTLGRWIVCYDHMSCHGSADYDSMVHNSRISSPDEYKRLLHTLEHNAGYTDLKVYKRRSQKMIDECKRNIERYLSNE